ncbi:uncharacterized protein ACLA_058370 [Aspergillus clavatus NRRL 1]|uniref:Uncharacterized protein n=1 Tax=Aspergillus clavatus (strain ATCC 1007 / CBS 513.65 / DSM 816 / NCTC 3887 / NRRL 1 / QM 1276 / 107) TaxID=344612 RepID=A1C439_ASPCL|nr:uncharacterized protein ACLA_058370 [Aspergillus clavatus NRRL 1]EAW15179.1 conserved hypothetical protein [Aspergillus clavatus NRRL 1]
MSSAFANRRKPRKVDVDDEENDGDDQGQYTSGQADSSWFQARGINYRILDTGPVVKRPNPVKAKQKSKLRLSFGPGETSMTEDSGPDSEVILPKRLGLGRRVLEKSTLQRVGNAPGLGDQLPMRIGLEQDRPSYSEEYLKELRDSTPSTPKSATDEEKDNTIDVAAKFGEVMKVSAPSAIPTEAEIREKKARRARLAKEQTYDTKEEDYISLEDNVEDHEWGITTEKEDLRDTRLIRDDEDFAEGFDEYVEDGRISLGKKAEREQRKKQREEMKELIEDAEGISDEDDSDLEEKAAYEAAQTRAAIGYGGKEHVDRPRTPPKMTSLPRLSTSLDRLRMNLAVLEKSRTQMINRMEELRKEKADIAVREVEIQALIKEAGDNYERLKQEAGLTPGSEEDPSTAGAMMTSRGLESFGASIPGSTGSSESES